MVVSKKILPGNVEVVRRDDGNRGNIKYTPLGYWIELVTVYWDSGKGGLRDRPSVEISWATTSANGVEFTESFIRCMKAAVKDAKKLKRELGVTG